MATKKGKPVTLRNLWLIVSTLLVLGVAAFLVACMPGLMMVFMMPGVTWPQIDEPNLVLRDCDELLRQHEDGQISRECWPESIKRLGPIYLYAFEDRVDIVLSGGGGIGRGWGFLVYPDKRESAQPPLSHSQRVGNRIYPGIFEYEMHP